MKNQLSIAAVAFFLGLSIGSFAVGQRQEQTVLDEKHQAPAAALATGRSSDDSPASGLDTMPPSTLTGAQGPELIDIELGSMSETEQLRALVDRWTEMDTLVRHLEKRLEGIETQLATPQSKRSDGQETVTAAAPETLPVATPEERRTALVAAGVPNTTAEEIVSRQSGLDLERLELQDLAMREGWYRSDRYFDEIRALDTEAVDLRLEVGEQAYDQFLYQTGESNRVKVTSVIQGSAAERSGLQPGDIVESYDGENIFSFSDLRDSTAKGAKGETVPVIIRRGDMLMEVGISRGPIGVRLEAENIPPGG